jgi:hypothetical protein
MAAVAICLAAEEFIATLSRVGIKINFRAGFHRW